MNPKILRFHHICSAAVSLSHSIEQMRRNVERLRRYVVNQDSEISEIMSRILRDEFPGWVRQ